MLTIQEGNDLISDAIRNDKPFFAGKYGSVELRLAVSVSSGFSDSLRQEAIVNAGIFPNDNYTLNKFCDEYLKTVDNLDLLGKPNSDHLSSQIKLNEMTKTSGARALEPYYHTSPWSHQLKNKKVLVISPFSDSIQKQYLKRKLIWENDLLPEFKLQTIKFPHSPALTGEFATRDFKTWFDLKTHFCSLIEKSDFDVLIAGCGAMGIILAHKAKVIGKIGIHLGGATQIFFGIKGSRWDTHSIINKFYNEHWVRPSNDEIPPRAKLVENGCYW